MPEITRRVYWDSCIFLAYLNAEPGRVDIIEAYWDDTANRNDAKIYTAGTSIVEVGYLTIEKEKKLLLPDTTEKIDKMWQDSSITIVDNHSQIMYMARELMRSATSHGWVVKPYDATHLATAMWINSNIGLINEFHTYDNKLPKLADIAGFPIIEPPDIRKSDPL